MPNSVGVAFKRIESVSSKPDVMFILGRTLKQMAEHFGKSVEHDSMNEPILDHEMYEVSPKGTFRVQ